MRPVVAYCLVVKNKVAFYFSLKFTIGVEIHAKRPPSSPFATDLWLFFFFSFTPRFHFLFRSPSSLMHFLTRGKNTATNLRIDFCACISHCRWCVSPILLERRHVRAEDKIFGYAWIHRAGASTVCVPFQRSINTRYMWERAKSSLTPRLVSVIVF